MSRVREAAFYKRLIVAPIALGMSGLLLATVGCGPRSDRLPISGKVILNGAPLDLGSIRFSSTGAGKQFASEAMVQNGDYQIPQQKGLPPGTYRVEINSPDTKAPLKRPSVAPGQPLPPPTAPDRIPAKYNTDSKESVEEIGRAHV